MKKTNWLFALIFLIYLLSSFLQPAFNLNDNLIKLAISWPHTISGDVPHYITVIYSLVYDKDFDVSNNYHNSEYNSGCDSGFNQVNKPITHQVKYFGKETRKMYPDKFVFEPSINNYRKIPDGPSTNLLDYRQYSVSPPGLPLLLSFFLWPLKMFTTSKDCTLESGAVFISIIFSIIGLFFLYKVLLHFVNSEKECKIIIFLFALATPLWHYSSSVWSENFLAALLSSALYFLFVKKNAFVTGIIIATAISIKFPFALIGTVIASYFLFNKKYKELILYSIPIILTGLLILFYNHTVLGSIFRVGQTYYFSNWGNPVVGYFGMLFSPSQGLLLFSPLLLLSILGLKEFYKTNKKECILLITIFITYYSFWAIRGVDWEGGGYSNRYLIPLLTLLSLPFVIAYKQRIFAKNHLLKILFYFAIFYSLIINLIAGIFPFLLWGKPVWFVFEILLFKFDKIVKLIFGGI